VRHLTKNELGIKFHAVFPQESEKFLIEAHFSVMRFLILYVSNDSWSVGGTHAECRIALLPRELMTSIVCPSRGIRFDGEQRLGQGHDGRELDEEMNVVLYAANGMNENPLVFANACRIGPQSRLEFRGNGLAPVLGAEDDMDHVLGVGVRHVSRLRR
jgi:hypothetical protein